MQIAPLAGNWPALQYDMCGDRSLCDALALVVATKRAACADVAAAVTGNASPSAALWKGSPVVMFAPALSAAGGITADAADGSVVTNVVAVAFSWHQARARPS